MYASNFIQLGLVALAGTVMAQYTCDAQDILDACVARFSPDVVQCGSSDYKCLCDQYTALSLCYNQCPGDQGVYAAKAQQSSYCSAASIYSVQHVATATTSFFSTTSSAASYTAVSVYTTSATGSNSTYSSPVDGGSNSNATTSTNASRTTSTSGASKSVVIPSTTVTKIPSNGGTLMTRLGTTFGMAVIGAGAWLLMA